MATKLIELDDGVLVEVEVSPDQAQPISGGMASRVKASLEKIQPVLHNVASSVAEEWRTMKENNPVHVKQAEISLGLSFEAEGNLYITKSKASANVTIKLTLEID